ncbi:unnamed protein product [Prunus brigantina]
MMLTFLKFSKVWKLGTEMLRVDWSFLHQMLKWLKWLVTYHPIRLLCYTI